MPTFENPSGHNIWNTGELPQLKLSGYHPCRTDCLFAELAGVSSRRKPLASLFPAVSNSFRSANKKHSFSTCLRMGSVSSSICVFTDWWLTSLEEKSFSCLSISCSWLYFNSIEKCTAIKSLCNNFDSAEQELRRNWFGVNIQNILLRVHVYVQVVQYFGKNSQL